MRDACAAVLAGGLSTRFGSDKAMAVFGGETLLARAVRTLREAGFSQILVVAKEPGRYAAFAEAVADETPIQTPLAGLRAALRASRHELVFACAADMPFVADPRLLDALTAAVKDAAVPRNDAVLQTLAALWRKSRCLPAADAILERGAPGPKALIAKVDAVVIDWPDERPFLDADTQEALEALTRAR